MSPKRPLRYVDRIMNRKTLKNGRRMYLTKWHDEGKNSWEPRHIFVHKWQVDILDKLLGKDSKDRPRPKMWAKQYDTALKKKSREILARERDAEIKKKKQMDRKGKVRRQAAKAIRAAGASKREKLVDLILNRRTEDDGSYRYHTRYVGGEMVWEKGDHFFQSWMVDALDEALGPDTKEKPRPRDWKKRYEELRKRNSDKVLAEEKEKRERLRKEREARKSLAALQKDSNEHDAGGDLPDNEMDEMLTEEEKEAQERKRMEWEKIMMPTRGAARAAREANKMIVSGRRTITKAAATALGRNGSQRGVVARQGGVSGPSRSARQDTGQSSSNSRSRSRTLQRVASGNAGEKRARDDTLDDIMDLMNDRAESLVDRRHAERRDAESNLVQMSDIDTDEEGMENGGGGEELERNQAVAPRDDDNSSNYEDAPETPFWTMEDAGEERRNRVAAIVGEPHTAFFNPTCAVGSHFDSPQFKGQLPMLEGQSLKQLWQWLLNRMIQCSTDQQTLMDALSAYEYLVEEHLALQIIFDSRTLLLAPPNDIDTAKEWLIEILDKLRVCRNAITIDEDGRCPYCGDEEDGEMAPDNAAAAADAMEEEAIEEEVDNEPQHLIFFNPMCDYGKHFDFSPFADARDSRDSSASGNLGGNLPMLRKRTLANVWNDILTKLVKLSKDHKTLERVLSVYEVDLTHPFVSVHLDHRQMHVSQPKDVEMIRERITSILTQLGACPNGICIDDPHTTCTKCDDPYSIDTSTPKKNIAREAMLSRAQAMKNEQERAKKEMEEMKKKKEGRMMMANAANKK